MARARQSKVAAKAATKGAKGSKRKLQVASSSKLSKKKNAKLRKTEPAGKGKLKLVATNKKVSKKPKKEISKTLLKALEKRKTKSFTPDTPNVLATPVKRRGRRPGRSAEYHSYQQEEENRMAAVEREGLEYDTGIKIEKGSEDNTLDFSRMDDYDEELNFDW